jgi:DNA-binding CsgD family transcriptional regulator
MTIAYGDPPETGAVPSAGSTRRLQALAFKGHTTSALARRLGISQFTLRRLIHGQPGEVPAHLAAAVAALYDELWAADGGSRRVARRARAAGFAPALAWDDNAGDPHFIDNPEAAPADWKPRRLTDADRAEDIAEILADGYTRRQAAWRLGVSADAITQRIARGRAVTP